ncbi:type II toxin-antitoxin system YafO family toxin (plasmid) [Vibrio sp. VNB-15]
MEPVQSLTIDEEDGKSFFVFKVVEHLCVDDFEPVLEEFIDYKTKSSIDDEMPAPSLDVQKDYTSVVEVFGRDKRNQHPRKESKEENLHHLHFYTSDEEDDRLELIAYKKWKSKPQYQRVSNTFIIYSYFHHKDIHYFYILDFIEVDIDESSSDEELECGGHEALKNQEHLSNWISTARAYRKSIIEQ